MSQSNKKKNKEKRKRTDSVESTKTSAGEDVRIRFCLFFVLFLGFLIFIFTQWTSVFSSLYLWPVSWTAATLIACFEVPVIAYMSFDYENLCIIEIDNFIFHVEHQCSGISAFFIYLAAIVAYPAEKAHKIRGILIGIPAFFIYGALRLVVLGLIAITIPDLLRFFHLYFMVILNLGFVIMLWADWIRKTEENGIVAV